VKNRKKIILTFDVEDWFQVENFKEYIQFQSWDTYPLRVEKNTRNILNLLDEFPFKPKATFFILGWIAERCPELVKEIHKKGHEVASHGFNHHLCSQLSQEKLLKDLCKSKKHLEQIINQKVEGFRAPSFAIDDNILKIIKSAGYIYDSSYNSFSAHGRYGSIKLSDADKKEGSYKIENNFYELPISNLQLNKKVLPLGGGGYFRLFPFPVFKLGIKSVLKKNNAFIFYAHPWEFDPLQPRVNNASKGFKFRHYVNLNKTESKLKSLLTSFSDHQFITCKEYIRQISCEN
jgi:polysaccharide deacetylase family protein (PEP-CTERM system associated)